MTYFADLTPYEYYPDEPELDAFNIGWLDLAEEYVKGETSQEFQTRLWLFCYGVVNPTRGFHLCNLCAESANAVSVLKKTRLGTAEIRVFHQDKTYAAPNLIYHYVVDHGYRPPGEFIEAVLWGPLPDSPQYIDIIDQRGNNFSYFDLSQDED